MLAGGHVLLEDVPGVGKTTLSHGVAAVLGLDYRRVQFTNDMLPSDLLGVNVFRPNEGRFEFHSGPVFHAFLLADEINRASPKLQSALLEAMEERQVSVDGETYPLPRPFIVMATQNPTEQLGTFPLPESQLDRFMMRLSMGYPAAEAEKQLYLQGGSRSSAGSLQAVCDCAAVAAVAAAGFAGNVLHRRQRIMCTGWCRRRGSPGGLRQDSARARGWRWSVRPKHGRLCRGAGMCCPTTSSRCGWRWQTTVSNRYSRV